MDEVEIYTPEDGEKFNTLKSLASVAILFTNDLKHMHVHCVGEKFKEMHELLNEYYDEVSDEADFFSEQAIIANEGVTNPTFALSNIVFPWEPETRELYEYTDYLEALWTKGMLYIEMLEGLNEGYGRVVDSEIDDYLKFWCTEIEYKLASQNVTALQPFDEEANVEPEETSMLGMFSENYKRKR